MRRRRRNPQAVRHRGKPPAASMRKATSSSSFLAVRRDGKAPVAQPRLSAWPPSTARAARRAGRRPRRGRRRRTGPASRPGRSLGGPSGFRGPTRAGRPEAAAPSWEGRDGSLPASEAPSLRDGLGASCPRARRVSCGAASSGRPTDGPERRSRARGDRRQSRSRTGVRAWWMALCSEGPAWPQPSSTMSASGHAMGLRPARPGAASGAPATLPIPAADRGGPPSQRPPGRAHATDRPKPDGEPVMPPNRVRMGLFFLGVPRAARTVCGSSHDAAAGPWHKMVRAPCPAPTGRGRTRTTGARP